MSLSVFAIIHESLTGCEYYRVLQPLEALKRERGYVVAVQKVNRVGEWMRAHGGRPPWLGFDIILYNRQHVPGEMLLGKEDSEKTPTILGMMADMRYAHKDGTAVIVDYDDDFLPDVAVRRGVYPEGWVLPNITEYDAITVSTPFLKRRFKTVAGKTPIHVLPNYIVPSAFINHERKTKPITLALTGSSTHKEDWIPAIEAINEIAWRRDNLTIFCSGFVPDSLNVPRLVRLPDLIPGHESDILGFEQYPFIMAQADIVLAPVDPSDLFNSSKSSIKALEAMASTRTLPDGTMGGCAVIATGGTLPCYQGVIKHGVTGLLVQNHSDKDEWKSCIEWMLDNPEGRMKMQRNGWRECLDKHDLYKNVAVYDCAYREIVNRRRRFS